MTTLSLAVKVREPERMSARLLIAQEGEIFVGQLTVQVCEPTRMSPSQNFVYFTHYKQKKALYE